MLGCWLLPPFSTWGAKPRPLGCPRYVSIQPTRQNSADRDLKHPESKKQVGVGSVTYRRSESVALRAYFIMAVAVPAYPPRTKWHRKLNNFPGSCLWQGRNLGLLWFQT